MASLSHLAGGSTKAEQSPAVSAPIWIRSFPKLSGQGLGFVIDFHRYQYDQRALILPLKKDLEDG
jgi:hypothetical protein